jgi:predicted AAA+ superfamily ATPase
LRNLKQKEKYRIVEQYFKKVQYSIRQDYSKEEAIQIAKQHEERAFAPEHCYRVQVKKGKDDWKDIKF